MSLLSRAAALLPVLSLLALSPAPGAAAAGAEFCSSVVQNLLRCATVPTADVDISQYVGKWYEIGVNAQFAFALFGQTGGQCVFANYSARGVVNGSNTIGVFNSALLTNSPVRRAQSLVISESAFFIGVGVKLLCQFLVGKEAISVVFPGLAQAEGAAQKLPQVAASVAARTPKLQKAIADASALLSENIKKVQQVADAPLFIASLAKAIKDSLDLVDLDNDTIAVISSETDKILAAVDAASVAASGIFGALEAVQSENLVLSGVTLPTPYSVPETVADIKVQTLKILALEGAITKARVQILNSAEVIHQAAKAGAPLIAAAAGGIAVVAADAGALAFAVAKISAARRVLSVTAETVQPEEPVLSIQNITGYATQSPTQPGALTVFFGPGGGPYNIIKIEGEAAAGYDLALVYSCSPSITTLFLPDNGFFILSRTPSVPQAVIDASLAFVRAQGILLAGDNAFLAINQNPELCKANPLP